MLVQPGSLIVAQMHYNTQSAAPVADQSTIEFALSASVERQAANLLAVDLGWISDGLIGGEAMVLPAGDPEVTHSTTLTHDSLLVLSALRSLGLQDSGPLVIHRANHHMHQLGTRQVSTVQHADGTESCLLDIPDWDFSWQGAYELVKPVVLYPGDSLNVSCTWDNSEANQPYVDGEVRAPTEVRWGEGTADEMCLAGLYVTGL
jgi:hypothetical protein